MSINEVLAEMRKRLTPSYEDVRRLERLAKDFILLLKKKGVKAYVGGSLAKGTLILGGSKPDIDLFAVFGDEQGVNSLGKILEKMKLPGKLRQVHGSREYYQVDCPLAVLEIVPVVERKDFSLADNVTDFSLSHVGYLNKEIEKNPSIVDEIRLAKAFCSAQKVYGAESYIHGFSGYSLEVLIVYFGSFLKFLKGVGKRLVIDPKKHFRTEKDALNEINRSKLCSPIVLVDPTYKQRNATAGLNKETFEKFLKVSKAFLKKPSLDFFVGKDFDVEMLRKYSCKKGARFVEVVLRTDRQEGDIAGTKMKKFFDFFVSELKRKKQKVLKKEFDYSGEGNLAKGYLVVVEEKEIEVKGPSVKLREEVVRSFKKAKGSEVFKKKGYWWFNETTSVKKIFSSVKRVEKEMGASGEIIN